MCRPTTSWRWSWRSPPRAGSLAKDGVPYTFPATILKSEIDAARITFVPALNLVGSASFNFQLQDDGGTANGGIDTSASAQFTFNVINPHIAPQGADTVPPVQILEDNSFAFGGSNGSDFGFSDPGDSPPDNFAGVFITTLPTNGSLTLNGAAVHANDFITAGNVLAGNLKFTPAPNANGTPSYASFTFQVQDTGTTIAGGQNIDASANTFTFAVTPVNDAPAGADNTINPALNTVLLEDSTYSFSAADFGFSDPNDATPPSTAATDPNSLQAVIITTLPTNGTLQLAGGGVNAGDSIPAGQLSQLTFTPALNANGAGYASFTFQVQDNGGTANGGKNLDQIAQHDHAQRDAGQRSADRRQ